MHTGRAGEFARIEVTTGRLSIVQVVKSADVADQVDDGVEATLFALRENFHLDPVPHLMRQYVPSREVLLRRNAENLSAVVGRISENEPEVFQRLVRSVSKIADHSIDGLRVIRSQLDDVMLVADEGERGLTPAREMSDGMLRFLAIATSLLGGGPTHSVVIEELENGLHPSQASMLLRLIKEATNKSGARVLATTHSPALLSALSGDDHRGVVVCHRDKETGLSRLTPLPQMPGYAVAMAKGRLGDVVSRGLLDGTPPDDDQDYGEFDRVLGIG